MILEVKNEPEAEYSFKHSLTQEVAYGSIPFARRRDLHLRVGEFLETHHKNDIEQFYELICHHYVRTANKWKAAEYSVKAGDKAKKIYSNQEASGHYKEALQYLKELPEGLPALEGRVRENLGDVYEFTGAYDLALESYEAGQSRYGILGRVGLRQTGEFGQLARQAFAGLPSSLDKDRLAAVLYRKRGMIHERKGQYAAALKYLDKGMGRIASEPVELARSYAARAGVLYRMGQYVRALEWCRRALQAAGESTTSEETAHSYYLMGTICTDMGDVRQAIDYRMKALAIYEEIGDLAGQAKVHNNLGVDFYYQGNWELAKVHYYRSLEIRSKIGDINGTATVSNNIGEILSDQGYLDEAEQAFQKCLETWNGIGYALGVALANSNLGRVHGRKGEWGEASAHLEESRQTFERLRSQGFLMETYQRLAEVSLGEGRTENAIQNCQESLRLAAELDRPLAAGVSHRILGRALMAQGAFAKAEEELAQSEKTLTDLNSSYELGQTLWQRALFYFQMDAQGSPVVDHGDVVRLLQSALDIFVRLGVRYDAAQAELIKTAHGRKRLLTKNINKI